MVKGGCQCGNVQYEADSAISDVSHCHCSMCRHDRDAQAGTDFETCVFDKSWRA